MCAHTQMTDVRVEVEVEVLEVRRRVEGRVWGQGRGPRTVIERQPNCFMSIDKVNHFPFSHFCLQIIRFVLFTRGFPHESFVLRLFTLVYTYIHKYACVCVCLCTLAVALFNDPKLVPEAQTQNKSKGAGKNSKRIWATIDTCAGRGEGGRIGIGMCVRLHGRWPPMKGNPPESKHRLNLWEKPIKQYGGQQTLRLPSDPCSPASIWVKSMH